MTKTEKVMLREEAKKRASKIDTREDTR